MQSSHHAQFSLSDFSGIGSEGFGSLEWCWSPPYSPCPLLCLIPALELCLYLSFICSSQNRMFVMEKCCLPLHSPFSSHILFLLSLLSPTILGYYQQILSVSTNSPWPSTMISGYYQQSLSISTNNPWLLARVLDHYQQSLSVITSNPWLVPQPSSYQCFKNTH